MTELVEFVRLRLSGGRFDRAKGMPVETLPELVAYQGVLLRVARALFLESHPDRQRVRKGFVGALDLRLRVIEDASVAPVLERVPTGELLPDEFERARDQVNELIERARDGSPLTSSLPQHSLAAFNAFGKTLRADEVIEIQLPSGARVEYTNEVRKRIVQLSGTKYSAFAEVDGFVSELDSQSHRFEILLPSGDVLSGPYAPELFDLLRESIADPPESGVRLRIEGDLEYSADDRPERIVEVSEAIPFDYVGAYDRIDELKALEEGWLDGEGEPIAASVLEQAEALLDAVASLHLAPPPRVFPTPDGGVQLEWMTAGAHVSLEVTEDGISLARVDISTNEMDAQDFDPTDLAPVTAKLRSSITPTAA